MPEWIFTFETTVARNYIGTLFESRFTGMYGDIIKAQPMVREQRALTPEFLIFNLFHDNILSLFHN